MGLRVETIWSGKLSLQAWYLNKGLKEERSQLWSLRTGHSYGAARDCAPTPATGSCSGQTLHTGLNLVLKGRAHLVLSSGSLSVCLEGRTALDAEGKLFLAKGKGRGCKVFLLHPLLRFLLVSHL